MNRINKLSQVNLQSFQAHFNTSMSEPTEEWKDSKYMTHFLLKIELFFIYYHFVLDPDWIKLHQNTLNWPDLYFQNNKTCIDKNDPAGLPDAAEPSKEKEKKKHKTQTTARTNLSKFILYCIFATSTLRIYSSFSVFSDLIRLDEHLLYSKAGREDSAARSCCN